MQFILFLQWFYYYSNYRIRIFRNPSLIQNVSQGFQKYISRVIRIVHRPRSFPLPVDSGDHAAGSIVLGRVMGGGGESRCQRLRSDAAAARSAGNRMEVSTSSVPAATPDHPENVHTHTIDPRGIFHSGFGNFSLEFRRHSPSSGHGAPKNTGQNVWKRKLEWTAPLCTGKTG